MPSSLSTLDRMKTLLLVSVFKLMSCLPFSWLRVIGKLFGRMAYFTNTRNTKVTRRNIELCFPELSRDTKETLVKNSAIHSSQCVLESAWVWFKSVDKILPKFEKVEGLEHFEAAKAAGKPVVFTGAHMGNWEALLNWVAQKTPSAIAYKMPKNLAMDPIIRKSREKSGVKMITGNRAGVKQMFDCLLQGETFVILSDQRPGKKGGVFAPFFNLPALTMTIVQKLVQKTDAQLLYFHALRTETGYKVQIVPASFNLEEQDEVLFAEHLNRGLTNLIAQHPEQFEWSYRRFRPLPDGYEPVYRELS
ncbi:lysophospholipid acyltransferase family protein [Pleionea litopenaei]|uniref:Lysophospholipid acyltransferase family protein n=1 Tax=Pleionea litopenaei TaxID=3070815 RepID=A0AA51RQY1_9GAMM|nr:lysophospholipid acyltransferase family protein [Pleionea sp. HL-JVS1]WMS86007.1 lysophospholipid acyltransferase family protein [Pleionea sp. HL-JVS1]